MCFDCITLWSPESGLCALFWKQGSQTISKQFGQHVCDLKAFRYCLIGSFSLSHMREHNALCDPRAFTKQSIIRNCGHLSSLVRKSSDFCSRFFGHFYQISWLMKWLWWSEKCSLRNAHWESVRWTVLEEIFPEKKSNAEYYWRNSEVVNILPPSKVSKQLVCTNWFVKGKCTKMQSTDLHWHQVNHSKWSAIRAFSIVTSTVTISIWHPSSYLSALNDCRRWLEFEVLEWTSRLKLRLA